MAIAEQDRRLPTVELADPDELVLLPSTDGLDTDPPVVERALELVEKHPNGLPPPRFIGAVEIPREDTQDASEALRPWANKKNIPPQDYLDALLALNKAGLLNLEPDTDGHLEGTAVEKDSDGELDSVGQYLVEISRIPLLAGKEEERDLAGGIEKGNEAARTRFITANLRLVVSVARRYTGNGRELLDLIQEGTIGLIEAVKRFDYRRGLKVLNLCNLVDKTSHHTSDLAR